MNDVLSALGPIAGSESARFLVQLAMLFALLVQGFVIVVGLALALKAGALAGQKQATTAWKDAAEGSEQAMDEAERLIGLLTKAREEYERALLEQASKYEGMLNGLKERLELRIGRLEAAVNDFGCKRAPSCARREPLEGVTTNAET